MAVCLRGRRGRGVGWTGDEDHTYTLAGVRQLASGKLLCRIGSPARHPVMPYWGGVGDPRGRRCMYTFSWFISLYGRNQHKIIKQAYSNKEKIERTPLWRSRFTQDSLYPSPTSLLLYYPPKIHDSQGASNLGHPFLPLSLYLRSSFCLRHGSLRLASWMGLRMHVCLLEVRAELCVNLHVSLILGRGSQDSADLARGLWVEVA